MGVRTDTGVEVATSSGLFMMLWIRSGRSTSTLWIRCVLDGSGTVVGWKDGWKAWDWRWRKCWCCHWSRNRGLRRVRGFYDPMDSLRDRERESLWLGSMMVRVRERVWFWIGSIGGGVGVATGG